jgi:hypothetical protein
MYTFLYAELSTNKNDLSWIRLRDPTPDRPVATTLFMKSLLAPKARYSHQSLGQRPKGYENRKNISAESAIHFRHTSWISANLNRAFSA